MQFERIYKICTHIQVKQEIQCDDNLIFIRITNGGEMSLVIHRSLLCFLAYFVWICYLKSHFEES